MNSEKEAFKKLLANINNITSMVEANRRLLAGISTLLIAKGLLNVEDIVSVEQDVSKILRKPNKGKKRKRKKE